MFGLYLRYILEILASVEEQFFELFKLTRSALSQHVPLASRTSLLPSCTWNESGFTTVGNACSKPDSQVFHCSFENIFVGLEAGNDLLGPLVLPVKVVEGPLHGLQVFENLGSLRLKPGIRE